MRFFAFLSVLLALLFSTCTFESSQKVNGISPVPYSTTSPCAVADQLLVEQSYQRAAQVYQVCLQTNNLHPLDSLYLINQIEYAYLQLFEIDAAQPWGEQANRIARPKTALPIGAQADIAFNRGRSLFVKHHYAAALPFLHQAFSLYHASPKAHSLRLGQVLTTIALLQYEYHPTADSLAHYAELAFEHFNQNTNLSTYASECYFAKGCASLYDRAHERGEGYAQSALKVLATTGSPQPILAGRLKTLLGNMYKKRGDIARLNTPDNLEVATSFHRAADSLIKISVDQLQVTGSSYWQESLRDWIIMGKRFADQQPRLLRNRLALYAEELENEADYYVFPNRLKAYDFVSKDRDSMIFYYERFLAEHLQRDNPNWQLQDEAFFRLRMGYLEKEEYENAIAYLLRGEALFACCPEEAAYRDYSMAQNAKNWSTPCLNGLVELIDILLARYQQQHTSTDLELAAGYLDTLDKYWITSILRSDEDALLSYFTEVGQEVYPQALQVMHQLWTETQADKYWTESFYFAERMKSFLSYRNQLAEWQDYAPIRELQAGVNRLNRLRSRRSLQATEQQQWLLLQDSLEQTLLNWRADSSAFTQAHQQTRYRPEELRKELSTKTGLLHITYHNQVYYVHYIDSETKTAWTVPEYEGAGEQIQQYQNSLRNKARITDQDVEDYQHSARQLFNYFIAPAGSSLEAHPNLLIVTDGPLANIPFEAFLASTEVATDNSISTESYLLASHTISYAPSWKMTFGKLANKAQAITPENGSIWTSGNLSGHEAMSSLHQTIQKSFPGPSQVNVDANVADFLKDASGVDLIHLSLHARSSSTNRHENAVYFGTRDTLYGYDIAATTLTTKLLVLAACETAAGPQRFGEGTFSLVSSFQQAGVEQIVASLWQVPEEATAILLQYFYQHLVAGLPLASALHQAKLDFIRKPPKKRMIFPAFWAGMVCY